MHKRHSALYLGIAFRHKQKKISEGVHRICMPTPRNMKEERAEYKILLRRFTLKQLFVKKEESVPIVKTFSFTNVPHTEVLASINDTGRYYLFQLSFRVKIKIHRIDGN